MTLSAHRLPGLLAGLALLAIAVLVPPAHAGERTWTLARYSGDVTITDTIGRPYAISPGFVVHPGDRIITGGSGRVMLTRGGDSIVMALNAMIEIPPTEKEGETPTVVQRQGTVTFDVEKQSLPHFAVETPHLGALVKGTTFVFDVAASRSQVTVSEGVVQVIDYVSGEGADLRAKQSATSEPGAKAGLSLSGEGPLPIIRQGAPRAPLFAATPPPGQVVPTTSGGSVSPGSSATAAAAPEPAAPARSRLLTLSYFLHDASSAEVILALVILGSIASGVLVWLALSLHTALRRRKEGLGRDRRPMQRG